MEPFLKIGLLLSLWLTGINSASLASAAEIVSPADAQRFEQSYEDWTKKIIHDLNPKLQFTVLSQIEFSRNPEQLQDYEDMKAVNHLPGLPEVMDQNYSNPLDSPLYALVAKKNFKIISHSNLSPQQISLFREVLNNKLKLRNDDSLKFETFNGVASDTTETPTKLHFKHNLKAEIALLFGMLLIAGTAFSFRRKKEGVAAAATKLQQKKSVLVPPPLKPALNGTHQIQTAPIEALRKCLQGEKPELIGRAALNANSKFNLYLLGECEENKLDLIVQWTQRNQKTVTMQDSNYARLLIAAKLQQIQNTMVLDSIDAFHHARTMKMRLDKSYTAVQSPEVKEANL